MKFLFYCGPVYVVAGFWYDRGLNPAYWIA